jgi:hypothetical protein
VKRHQLDVICAGIGSPSACAFELGIKKKIEPLWVLRRKERKNREAEKAKFIDEKSQAQHKKGGIDAELKKIREELGSLMGTGEI